MTKLTDKIREREEGLRRNLSWDKDADGWGGTPEAITKEIRLYLAELLQTQIEMLEGKLGDHPTDRPANKILSDHIATLRETLETLVGKREEGDTRADILTQGVNAGEIDIREL